MTIDAPITVRPVRDAAEWNTVRDIRIAVFVDEQGVRLDAEFDEHEETARHFVCVRDGRIVGTARWRAVHDDAIPAAKLERFAVLDEARGFGCGHRLIEHLISDARNAGFTRFILHAQAHLTEFYGAHGFVAEGPVFLEEDIRHVRMMLDDHHRRA